MSFTPEEIAKAYERNEIIGWKEAIKPGSVKIAWSQIGHKFKSPVLFKQHTADKESKVFLHHFVRKALGQDTPNYAQQIGDCVSFGAKNATEYLACCDIVLRKEAEKFRPVYPPFYYGTSRVLVGGWEGDMGDGSLGSYMAEAVMKYGTLFSDEPNVPKYSGSVAKQYGAKSALLKPWLPTTQKYLVKSAALVTTWDEYVASIVNGYPVTLASSIGYSMEVGADGFHRQITQWNHQVQGYGVDCKYKNGEEPYALLLNSWGDSHGHLKDFETGDDLPIGTLRIRRKDLEKHLRAKESFAFSQYDGFPGQKQRIEKELFKLF